MIELLLSSKMLRVSVVLLSVLCVVYAAQSLGRPGPKPEKFKNVPGCYIKHLDQVIPPGEAITNHDYCTELRCGGEFVINSSCGVLGGDPLDIVQDKSKPYPDCCPRPKDD